MVVWLYAQRTCFQIWLHFEGLGVGLKHTFRRTQFNYITLPNFLYSVLLPRLHLPLPSKQATLSCCGPSGHPVPLPWIAFLPNPVLQVISPSFPHWSLQMSSFVLNLKGCFLVLSACTCSVASAMGFSASWENQHVLAACWGFSLSVTVWPKDQVLKTELLCSCAGSVVANSQTRIPSTESTSSASEKLTSYFLAICYLNL